MPATSNQVERDLRPSKIQQNISGWLTSHDRTHERDKILGYLSTAAKHGLNQMNARHGPRTPMDARVTYSATAWPPPDQTTAITLRYHAEFHALWLNV